MPSTYTLIASNTLGASAASVTFSSIPSTYTDLVVRWSVRSDRSANSFDDIYMTFNSGTISQTFVGGNGASTLTGNGNGSVLANTATAASATSNTFSSGELYIPNYAGSTNKPASFFSAAETNATTAYLYGIAILRSNTAAISSIALNPYNGTNFVSGSSFYLYGIKNS